MLYQALAVEEVESMFWFGFIVGAVAATVFILYGNGDLLVKLRDQIKSASDRFWESQKK